MCVNYFFHIRVFLRLSTSSGELSHQALRVTCSVCVSLCPCPALRSRPYVCASALAHLSARARRAAAFSALFASARPSSSRLSTTKAGSLRRLPRRPAESSMYASSTLPAATAASTSSRTCSGSGLSASAGAWLSASGAAIAAVPSRAAGWLVSPAARSVLGSAALVSAAAAAAAACSRAAAAAAAAAAASRALADASA